MLISSKWSDNKRQAHPGWLKQSPYAKNLHHGGGYGIGTKSSTLNQDGADGTSS